MGKIKTGHIDEALPENMKGLAKQYYVRARKAEAECNSLQNRIRALENRLTIVSGIADDLIGAIER